jgi:hypothetical protein
MLKKILMTAAAALAITAGATTLSTSDANARGRVSINPSGGDVGRGYSGGGDNIQPRTFNRRFSCRRVHVPHDRVPGRIHNRDHFLRVCY